SLGGERHGVRTHVGDEADAAFADVHALIQLLSEPHRAARVESELACRLLLQRRSRERRRRIAPPLLAFDGDDTKRAVRPGRARPARGGLDRARDLACLRFVDEAELLDLRAAVLHELQREALRGVLAFAVDRPVLARLEGGDLLLALADHPERRALHA